MSLRKNLSKAGALVLVGILLLTGCGSKEEQVSGEASQSASVSSQATSEAASSAETESSEEVPSEPDNGEIVSDTAPGVILTGQSYDNYFYDEDSDFYANVCIEIPAVAGVDYPELRDSLHNLLCDLITEVTWFEDTIEEAIREGYTEGEDNWYSEVFYTVARNDAKILSFWLTDSTYAGGAHPSSYIIGHNYEIETGKEIGIKDFVKDSDGLRKLVIERLEALEDSDFYFEDWKETVNTLFEENSLDFVLYTDSVEFMFNQYCIAPYVAGPISLTVEYEDNKELFNGEYFVTPELKVMKLPLNYYDDNTFYFDGNGDGKTEVLRFDINPVYYDSDDYYYIDYIEGTIGYGSTEDSLTTVDISYCYDISDAYVCETKGGKYYLLVEYGLESDWNNLVTYDLSNPSAGPVERYNCELGALHNNPLTDPSNFVVQRVYQVIGTHSAANRVYLANDGTIKLLNDDDATILGYYNNEDKYPYNRFCNEALVDFKAKDHETGETVTVKAGTNLYPVYTNRENGITFQTEKNEFIDVIYSGMDEDSWQFYIDDMPEDEVLANIIYAG